MSKENSIHGLCIKYQSWKKMRDSYILEEKISIYDLGQKVTLYLSSKGIRTWKDLKNHGLDRLRSKEAVLSISQHLSRLEREYDISLGIR